jgi:hypothetical protein
MEASNTFPSLDRYEQLKSLVQFKDGQVTIASSASQKISKWWIILLPSMGVLTIAAVFKIWFFVFPTFLFTIIMLYYFRLRHIVVLDCIRKVVTVKMASKDSTFQEYAFSDLVIRADQDDLTIELINRNGPEVVCTIPVKDGRRVVFEQMHELLSVILCNKAQVPVESIVAYSDLVNTTKTVIGALLAFFFLIGLFLVYAVIAYAIVYITNTGVWGGVTSFVALIEIMIILNVRLAKKSASWPTVTGKIISTGINEESERNSSRKYYSANVEYEYEIDGRKHRNRTISFVGQQRTQAHAQEVIEKYTPGNDVIIYHHPKKHSQSVLEPGMIGGVIFPVVLGVVVSVMWVVSSVMSPGMQPQRLKSDYINFVDSNFPLNITIDNLKVAVALDKTSELEKVLNSLLQDSIVHVYRQIRSDTAELYAKFHIYRDGDVWVDSLWTHSCDQNLKQLLRESLQNFKVDSLLVPRMMNVSLRWKLE